MRVALPEGLKSFEKSEKDSRKPRPERTLAPRTKTTAKMMASWKSRSERYMMRKRARILKKVLFIILVIGCGRRGAN